MASKFTRKPATRWQRTKAKVSNAVRSTRRKIGSRVSKTAKQIAAAKKNLVNAWKKRRYIRKNKNNVSSRSIHNARSGVSKRTLPPRLPKMNYD